MNPDKIILEDFNKMFEYEKLSRDIDSIDDIEVVKNFAKSYIKLYLKQQEVVSKL
jgi:sortase (surface protein transpeptidase)